MSPVEAIDGDVLALVAVRVGDTRLIDNTMIHLKCHETIQIDREVATPDGASTVA
jgi:hypothetical protein